MLGAVVEANIVLYEQGVNLHPSLKAKHAADFGLGETPRTIAFNGKRFKSGPRSVFARGYKLRG
jgi:hypothetical protein